MNKEIKANEVHKIMSKTYEKIEEMIEKSSLDEDTKIDILLELSFSAKDVIDLIRIEINPELFCPKCYKRLNDNWDYAEIFDRETGGYERYKFCSSCKWNERDEEGEEALRLMFA